MKKIIVTTLAVLGLFAATTVSYGQGEVQFQNNTAATPITFGAGPSAGSRVFGSASLYTYGLYVGSSTATTLSQLTLIDTVGSINSANGTSGFAGYINGQTVSGLGNVGAANGFAGLVGGTLYAVEVAAWPTSEGANYAAALAADTGTGYFGLSGISTTTPTASPSPVDQLFGAGNAFPAGFTLAPIVVPEPSTIVLGGLGAAALLAFRRRK